MNALVNPAAEPRADGAKAMVHITEQKQYLTFLLGGEMYSIDILRIREIIWYAGLTEVPMMPACIRGVINLRGAVVPVMDLSTRFGKPVTPLSKSTCIVIIDVAEQGESSGQSMGVVVDAVQAVLEIPASEIEPPPNFGARIRSDFIEGIGKVNGKFVIVLNVAQAMSITEISTLGKVAAGEPEAAQA